MCAEPLAWSADAETLRDELRDQQLQRRSREPIRMPLAQIVTRFTTLKLHQCKISEMDEGLLRFTALQELSLTNNQLERLQHLPSGLQMLRANGNRCDVVDRWCVDVCRGARMCVCGEQNDSCEDHTLLVCAD